MSCIPRYEIEVYSCFPNFDTSEILHAEEVLFYSESADAASSDAASSVKVFFGGDQGVCGGTRQGSESGEVARVVSEAFVASAAPTIQSIMLQEKVVLMTGSCLCAFEYVTCT